MKTIISFSNKVFIGCFYFLFCCVLNASSQSVMKGKVVNSEKEAIPEALVMILDAEQNTLFSENADSLGMFSITLPTHLENCWLYVGSFQYQSRKMNLIDAIQQTTIILERHATMLNEIVFKNNRPTITREMDKFVIPQVYSSPLAQGKNIIDFLGYAPLVNVNLDGVLEILGKGQASIYINGKKSNINLRSIPAENIENVEIITHPGSQYPATERNGIINIILRKPLEDGTLVNITLSDSQKEKWSLNSPSVNIFLMIQKKKLNITTGISAYYSPLMIKESGVYHYYSDSLDNYTNIMVNSSTHSLSGFVNLDYHINTKHTLGFRIDARTYYRKENQTAEMDYYYFNPQKASYSDTTQSKLSMTKPNYSLHANLNYNIKFNAKQKLSFDLDFNHSQTESPNYFQYRKFEHANIVLSEFLTQTKTRLDGFSFKTNFQNQFSDKIQLDVGVESYGAIVDNDYFYGNRINDEYISDTLQTNRFLFKDITGAAYIDFDWEISDKWSLSAGLRGEIYGVKGVQQATREEIAKQYPNLFPSFSVSYMPHDDHELSFDFTTRYFLPGYSMLNPFKLYYSPNLYKENNPNLQPAKMYDFGLNYTLFSDYMFIFEYTYSQNSFSEFKIPVGDGVSKMMSMNFGKGHDFDIIFCLNKNLFKNYLYLSFSADLSYFIAKNMPKEVVAYNESGFDFMTDIKINTAMSKKKDWRFETRFQFCPKITGVSMTISTSYYLSASISKSFKRSALSFGVNDILDKPLKISMDNKSYGYIYARTIYGRTYWISYNIKFGNNRVRGTESRNSDKVQNRIQ